MMKSSKVIVIGSPGSGKSTLSIELAQKSGLPLYHLDQLFWCAGWQKADTEIFMEKQRAILNEATWIIDGNYGSSLSERAAFAELIIWLDPPTAVCVWRIIKRVISNYGRTRRDMAADCPECFSWEFIHYVCSFKRKHDAAIRAAITLAETNGCQVLRITSKRDYQKLAAYF